MGGETKCDICGRTREEAAFLFAKMAHEAVHIPKSGKKKMNLSKKEKEK